MTDKSHSQTANGFGNEDDKDIKVALVGAPGVGKTSLVQVIYIEK
jgi:GTPase SAR1 family protein